VLFSLPGVADAVVVGLPDRYRGETVKAYVVRAPGATLSEDDVVAHASASLTAYKVPKLVEFRDALPRNAVGKLLRRVLVEEEAGKSTAQEKAPAKAPAAKAAAPKPAAKKAAPAKKAPAKKAPAKKGPATKAPAKTAAKLPAPAKPAVAKPAAKKAAAVKKAPAKTAAKAVAKKAAPAKRAAAKKG
jgi:hypothetical protein